ncbi:uncharacterized protein hwt [Cloeon dipterum]|uniref:uncharacterized protein hwt n=1 Tax=Cloeon dipterum TaxID=197152 RepID=UPI00321F9434
MERVWKRVALARKKEQLCYKPAAKQKVAPSEGSKVPKDFMWCDLVTASSTSGSSPASPPPAAPELPPRPKGFVLELDLNARALTRRLFRRDKHKQDNQLYRSNSFRFEKYHRPDEDLIDPKVSVCDEYSLPVDFVNRRTRSFASGLANWTPSPSGENLQVLAGYSDPRDCKAYLEPGEAACNKVYASPDADKYSRPHRPPKEREEQVYCSVRERASKASAPACARGSASKRNKERRGALPDAAWSYDADVESPLSEPRAANGRRQRRQPHSMPCDALVRSRSSVCVPCRAAVAADDDPEPPDAMTGRAARKHIYETAFDSRVSKSEDELDEVDRVSNHPVLRMLSRAARGLTPRGHRKEARVEAAAEAPGRLAAELAALRVSATPTAPAATHTPPSTAPLPAKFHAVAATGAAPAGAAPTSSMPDLQVRRSKRPTSLLVAAGGHGPAQAATRPKYSSTESMATSSSSMSSLDSLRSSTSEGNRSTTSSASRRSDSLSSHSSDSGGDLRRAVTGRCPPLGLLSNKLHILSPISDKSQEPGSETSDNNRKSQRASPEEAAATPVATDELPWDMPKLRRRGAANRGVACVQVAEALQGSDSGISIESRHLADDLPFDMPKLRRRLAAPVAPLGVAGGSATSSSAASVAGSSHKLDQLPFDMPKLRRRQPRPASALNPAPSLPATDATDSAGGSGPLRPPSLDLGGPSAFRPVARSAGLNLNLGCVALTARGDDVDVSIPLERQGWFHGAITRVEAEAELRLHPEGSYLVRNSESSRQDFSLSLKSARGFMHMRIQQEGSGHYILGQFSKPFACIPRMVHYYSVNRLPIRGAEHMCLLHPVIEQLL